MRIGCVGIGNIGRHLAANLLAAGFDVTVHDLDRSACAALEAAGATWAPSPAAVAASVDTVVTCLPSVKAITAVVAGESGLLEGFQPGATWIDMSTNDLHELQRLAGLLAERGVATLEAPVTGGAHNAESATITVLVGGDESVYQRHTDVFDAVGGRVFYMGELGKAAIIKVITNMLAFIHLVAAGEALMLAKRGGLDLAQSFEAIKASSGNSFVHETESQVILNGSYNINFTMDLACKDLGFAMQMGRDFGVPLDLAGLTEQTFIRARSQYGGSAWSSQVVKLLEDALGTDLRAPGFPAVLEGQ
jgi:3-hydroxyisobutyrate dehydrogenase